jgi:hypothetical protein
MAICVLDTNIERLPLSECSDQHPDRGLIYPNVRPIGAYPALAENIGTCSSFFEKGENSVPTKQLSRVRKSILPVAGDTWQSIARRELSDMNIEEGVSSLQSWNLHVFMRSSGAVGGPKSGNPILPSDVIFVEPPMSDA